MPTHESDISWQVLGRIVHDWAGDAAELAEVHPLQGGCINTTLKLTTTDGARCVIKIAPHRVARQFLEEAHQLELLRKLGFPTPQVYRAQLGCLDNPHSYLLMEFVDGIDLAEARRQLPADDYDAIQTHLAELVLQLHDHAGEAFGRVAPDEPRQFQNWPAFYHDIYDPIVKEVEQDGHLTPKCRKCIHKIHDRIDRLLDHGEPARLVHWDLWATNVLVAPDAAGRWRIAALLDPMCKYAHAEAEIAYLELFHTITPAFMRVYQAVHRLPNEYHRLRKAVYQLYPLLNHVRLFGQEYIDPMRAALDRVYAMA